LKDNGVPQKVTLEEESKRPLSVVVLMQTGGIARGQFSSYAGLETMLASLLGGAPNKISIVNFDSQPEAASPFTSDVAQWRDAIDRPEQGNSGAAIFDSLEFGLELLKKEPPRNRRVIVLISQERDDGSKTPLSEIVRDPGETNTAIYSVMFSAQKTAARQAFKDPPHLNPPFLGSQAYFSIDAPLRLIFGAMQKNLSAEVANLSGGESNSFDNKYEFDEALNRVNSHIRNSYVLSFQPTSTDAGLHMLKVSLARHPEMVVSARTSYWAGDLK
jgi:VWFA-related protein